jgi:hypothetical protein
MNLFLKKTAFFLILSFVIYHFEPFYLLYTRKFTSNVTGSEIYYSIYKSKKNSTSKKLLIGDSVGNQLFPALFYSDTINSICSNQAIGLVGNYLLVKNYIEAGNKFDTLFMIFNPLSFLNNLNQIYTYQYFLKPFYNNEYKPYFNSDVIMQVKKIPFYFFAQYPTVLTSNWVPDFSPTEGKFTFLSPISIFYLNKIKELSLKHKFKIRLISTPTSLKYKSNVLKFNKQEYAKSGMIEELDGFIKSIIFVDDSCFKDGIHLKNPQPYTSFYKKNFLL